MSQIRLRILGESVIQVGETIVEPSATHVFALLLYLGIERGKLVSRSQLASMLFPEGRTADAGHSLRQLLYRLRRIGVPLETTAAAVRLPAESVVEAPESVLTQSLGRPTSKESLKFTLLPTYTPPTESLSRWVETYRDEISSKLLRCFARELTRAREGADWSAVERLARALLELDPLNETATLGLAEAMARTGSKYKALELLHAFADDVGRQHAPLALPSRLLRKRIAEEARFSSSHPSRAPLIGRAEELRSLTDAWSLARRGTCAIAVVTGEKSIGKSRVLEEMAELVRMDGSGVVLTARTLPADSERPMSLFSDMCAALLALPGAAGCNPGSLPHLSRLQGALGRASDAHHVDINVLAAEAAMRRAIVDLLESVSSERPLLISVDDAEQLDDSSRALLADLPELSPSLPLLFVLAANRVERLPQRRIRTVRLGPLTRDNALMLARLYSDRTPHSSSLQTLEWCVDSAGGNPGHLDLLVAHTASLCDTPVAPPDLIALLDSRIESLSPPARHVLQACVAFGADCCPATVAALTGIDGYELLLGLECVVEAGLVIDSEAGFSCRSSLLAERVRGSTTPAVWKLLHRRSAVYLEGVRDVNWTSQATAWRIADHWQAAGDRSQALKWRRACWHHLHSIGQPMAAADSIRRYLPNSACDGERAALLDDLINALQHGSDIVGQLSALSERIGLSDRIGDSSATRLRLAADTAEARVLNYEDLTSLLPQLQAQLVSTELDSMRRLRAARTLMIAADSLLDEMLARKVYDAMPGQLLSVAESLLKGQVELIFHTVFGDRETALILAESLTELADSQEPSPASVSAQLSASLALRIVGCEPIDTRRLERLFDRCVASSMFDAAIRTSSRIGSFKYEDGAIESAQFWCERTSALVAQTRAERLCSDHITLQIDLALERGDYLSAQRLVDSAPRHCPMYKSPRFSREYLVYQLRVTQHQGGSGGSSQEVQSLVDWHKSAKRLGRQDDCVQVLWTAFWSVGKRAEASSLLREYLLNARRERRNASYVLRTRTCEDPIWSKLAAGYLAPGSDLDARTSVFPKVPSEVAQRTRHETHRRACKPISQPQIGDRPR